MNDTKEIEDFEALLTEEVPCGGILQPAIARTCSASATLHSNGHGCAIYCKCVACWKTWYQWTTTSLVLNGSLQCKSCHAVFHSVEDFSDYEPF